MHTASLLTLCSAATVVAYSAPCLGRPGAIAAASPIQRAVLPTMRTDFVSVSWNSKKGWLDQRMQGKRHPGVFVPAAPAFPAITSIAPKPILLLLLATVALSFVANPILSAGTVVVAKATALVDAVVNFAMSLMLRAAALVFSAGSFAVAKATALVDAIANFAMSLVLRAAALVVLMFEFLKGSA